jgi:hypothetical protein
MNCPPGDEAEVTVMKLLGWILLVLACAVPALLVALALGPVILAVLCAAGFAAVVAGTAYVLGVAAGSVGKAGAWFVHRGQRS